MFVAVMMALSISVVLLPAQTANVSAAPKAQTETVQLTVHYFRYGGDYTGWDMWIWAAGKDGTAHEFTADDNFGKSLTVDITSVNLSESLPIGIIVKKGDWADRDVAMDRFIAVDKIQNNQVEIYLVENDVEIYYKMEDADTSPKFKAAIFDDAKIIRATLTNPLTDELKNSIELRENGVAVEADKIASVSAELGKKFVKYTLKENADLGKSYSVYSPLLGERSVSLEKLYDTKEFEDQYNYNGELGAVYTKAKTEFKLWAPTASAVSLNRYTEGSGNNLIETTPMTKGDKGVWSYTVNGDINGEYYTYTVTAAGLTNEVVDPYTKSAGVNGKRGMIIDTAAYNPEGWENQKWIERSANVDSIIYEAHVRDLTIDESSGVSAVNRGKFLGMTETGTKNAAGLPTALDHLVELGVTELHLNPIYDYGSVDESTPEVAQFNWGYDPQNYNVPEGSYSTDATKGEVRVSELKQLVMALHKKGIRVIMDVVYNHTQKSEDSDLNLIVPNYYYRLANGKFSNGSGCGNETASERAMYGKFMLDSVLYWQQEYKIDGFRFDLMALHDIDTMNKIADSLLAVNPGTLIYGEGWTGGTTPLPESKQALKKNAAKMPKIAVFSDDIRDGIKGSVFNGNEPGFVQGSLGREGAVKSGILGATPHGQTSGAKWALHPTQSINYVSAHDNYTLHDKIEMSAKDATPEQRVKMNQLSGAIVLTSQGVPFFLAGEEMLRSKPKGTDSYDENSYKSPDSVNSIKWNEKTENKAVFDFYKQLIALRKAMPQFRLKTGTEVAESIVFYELEEQNVIGYTIHSVDADGNKTDTVVFFNSNKEDKTVTLEKSGQYKVYLDGDAVSVDGVGTVNGNAATVKAIGALVMIRTVTTAPEKPANVGLIVGLSVGGAVLLAGGGALAFFLIKKKRKTQ